MKKYLITLTLLIFVFDLLFAQNTFQGSFTMSFNISESAIDSPLLWNIEPVSDGGKMAMEIQDEMIKKGVSKRVLFNPADSTWTMMIAFNKIKQGSRIHAAAMFRDTTKRSVLLKKSSTETRKIDGYHCKKIILESEKYTADIWVTDEIKFDLTNIYRLMCHCGMMSENVRKGDWYLSKGIKSMIMEITSRNKISGENYTMKITSVKPGEINKIFFTTEGFKIADIPEGLNCGVVMEGR